MRNGGRRTAARRDGGWSETTAGRGRPEWDIRAPRSERCTYPRAAYIPAARSWSRSSRDGVGECCGRFSPSGAGAASWRWRATVRLATMAAMAMRLTPKVRISASRHAEVSGAPSGATCSRTSEFRAERSFVPAAGPKRDPSVAQIRRVACRTTLQRANRVFPDTPGSIRLSTGTAAPFRALSLTVDSVLADAGPRRAGAMRQRRHAARLPGANEARTLAAPTGGLTR
jgi:hypothetical protein